MKCIKLLLPLLLLFVLTGCEAIQREYAEADKATYEVFWPAHQKYVEEDATLDDEAKARRKRLGASWKVRFDTALEDD